MTIQTIKNEDALTVSVTGRLDTTTSPELDEELKKSLDGIRDLTMDLEGLEYISSAGLRILLSTQKTMNQQGTMKLINVSSMVMDVFEVTGFAGYSDHRVTAGLPMSKRISKKRGTRKDNRRIPSAERAIILGDECAALCTNPERRQSQEWRC